jgi:hypothetical protein
VPTPPTRSFSIPLQFFNFPLCSFLQFLFIFFPPLFLRSFKVLILLVLFLVYFFNFYSSLPPSFLLSDLLLLFFPFSSCLT